MTTNSKPSRIIKIDKHTDKIVLPTILLQTRSFKTIGKLNYTNFNASLVANGIDEISFEIHKYVDGRICPIWDDIEDLKLVKVEDYGRFQIRVSYTDSTETVKAIHGQSLEVELGQLMLNNFHVNDDEATDMVYTDYSKDNYDKVDDNNYVFVPTVFYNDKDPKRSLLHRVLADKAPHWKIGHVPTWVSMSEDDVAELANTFKRMYTVDGTSIYDFLTGEVAKETNVIFVFDTLGEERIINCYSLIDCYDESGKLVEHAYGNDTNIFVSKKNLASEISIESNQDELKNCFRVEGGDDLITASVAAVNMNGTNYIWCFSDLQLRDMSEELRNKIKDYQTIMSSQETKDLYYGENGIYTRLTNAYEELYQKESSLMPTITAIDPGDAKTQYEKVVDALQTSTVYVTSLNNYSADSHVGLDSMVVEYASVFMDSRFEIEVINDKDSNKSQFDKNAKLWKGKFKITQRTDSSNTYPTIVDDFEYIKVDIEDKSTENGELEFVRQKTLKALAESDMQNFDFTNIDEDEARSYFEKFALNRLTSFYDAYDRCLSIMGDFGIVKDEEDERRKLYNEYYKILTIIGEVKKVREQEVADIKVKIGNIETEQKEFQNSEQYNFEKFLGEELYSEFCLYRREDTYSNSNYISDNLNTTTEQLEKAQELLKVAETELKKACVLQRTVSASLNNLLVLPEFEPLYEEFALYNFIRIKTEDEIIKLRLIKIEFDGDSVESINVTFSEQIETVDKKLSDMESVLQQASSIATSYSSTVKQAKQGANANNQYVDMVTNGLVAAKTSLATDIHNEVEITGAGIIARRMDDEGSYGDKQLKISGNRMYFTDNAWQSVSMAIGEINFNGEDRYGVLADVICGNLIAGNQMIIGNENGSVEITGDGINITNGTITWGDGKVNAPEISDIDGLSNELSSLEDYINEQIDGRIETFSQPSTNDPSKASSWGNNSDHIGDLWVVTDTGEIKQWDGSTWQDVTDPYLESLAKTKARIFTVKPMEQYYIGDMLIPSADFTVNNVTFIKNKAYRAYKNSVGTTFNPSDWDALDYSNDDELTEFIENTYANNLSNINSSLNSINTQLDKKADTYYQGTVPAWTNGNANHVGDLWYCTTNVGTYVAGKTYMFDGTKWNEVENVPDSVFDLIDGKRQIFVSKPTNVAYRTGDLWIVNANDGTITINGVTYKENSTLVAILPNGVKERTTFTLSDWHDISTHDGIVALDKSTEALSLLGDISSDQKITPSEKQQLKLLMDNITSEKTQVLNQCTQYGISTSGSTYYSDWSSYNSAYTTLNTCVSNVLSNMSTTTDVPSNFSSSFENYYNALEKISTDIEKATKEYSDKNLNDYKEEVKDFQNKVNTALTGSTTEIGSDYVISPKIGGGYLYIKDARTTSNTEISVEINPNGTSFSGHNSNYVFNVQKNNNIIMGVTNNGQGYFSGGGKFTGTISIDGTNGVGAIDIIGNATTDRLLVHGASTIDKYTNTYSRVDYQKFYVGDNSAVSNAGNGIIMSVYDILARYPHIRGWADGGTVSQAYLYAKSGFEIDSSGFMKVWTDEDEYGYNGHCVEISPSKSTFTGIYATSFSFVNDSNNLIKGNNSIVAMGYIAEEGYISVGTTNGGYGITVWASDTKLKKNIIPTTQTALDKINNLDFIQFDWKDREKHVDLGLSANQVEEIIPDAIFDVVQDDSSEFDTLKNIDTTTMTVYALKAIKELSDIVEAQQQQIKELKGEK